MKISRNSSHPTNNVNPSRRQLEGKDLTEGIASERWNDYEKNGTRLLHAKGEKGTSSLKGRVKRAPSAGNGDIAAQKVFRKRALRSG